MSKISTTQLLPLKIQLDIIIGFFFSQPSTTMDDKFMAPPLHRFFLKISQTSMEL